MKIIKRSITERKYWPIIRLSFGGRLLILFWDWVIILDHIKRIGK